MKKNGELFKAVFEQAAVGMGVISSSSGKLKQINQHFCDIFGNTVDELSGRSILDLIHPDDKREINTLQSGGLISENQTVSKQLRCIRKDGTVVWVQISISPIGNEGKSDDEPVHVAVLQDITEPIKTESTLIESESKLRALFDAVSEFILMMDRNGTILELNQAAAERLGGNVNDFIGQSADDFILPQLAESRGRIRDRAFKTGTAQKIEDHRGDIWLETVITPIREDNGKIKKVATISRDITHRKRIETELRESDERYRALFERSSDAVLIHDLKGKILEINPTAQTLLGGDKEEMFGTNIVRFMYRENIQTARMALNEITETGTLKESFQYRLKNNKKQSIWVESTTSLLMKEGKPYAVQEIARDITLRKKYEQELLKAKLVADQANQAKSEFLANISHELRTPMQAVLGFSKLGLDRIDSINQAKTMQYFLEIYTAGKRLLNMVNNLLDLSRLEAGMEVYQFRRRKVSKVVLEVLEEFDSIFKDQNIEVVFENSNIPGFASFDKDKIMQVVRNLLANAVKFSKIDSSIIITLSEMKEGPTISIKDQGPGIPHQELKSIFDKFVQSSKTDTGAGGTGLGLAICQEIIKAHSGRIWAENNTDNGATFHFTLPVKNSVFEKKISKFNQHF